jgi:membrane-associated protease RseP (regulator of RpoE activity)
VQFYGSRKDEGHLLGAYFSKSIWQRLWVSVAGPIANILTAFLFIWVAFFIGWQYQTDCKLDAYGVVDPSSCQTVKEVGGQSVWMSFTLAAKASARVPVLIGEHVEEIVDGTIKDIKARWGNEPVGIVGAADVIWEGAQEGAGKLLIIMWAFSLIIGFGNLLPFPPLDGSHIWLDLVSLLRDGWLRTSLRYVWIAFGASLLLSEFVLFIITSTHDLWLLLAR